MKQRPKTGSNPSNQGFRQNVIILDTQAQGAHLKSADVFAAKADYLRRVVKLRAVKYCEKQPNSSSNGSSWRIEERLPICLAELG